MVLCKLCVSTVCLLPRLVMGVPAGQRTGDLWFWAAIALSVVAPIAERFGFMRYVERLNRDGATEPAAEKVWSRWLHRILGNYEYKKDAFKFNTNPMERYQLKRALTLLPLVHSILSRRAHPGFTTHSWYE